MDVIIVSCGKSKELQRMTQNAVNSCANSYGDFNIIVVENCNAAIKYENCTTLYYPCVVKGRFNYNHALNYGIQHCQGEYIACCNNDIVFDAEWARNMLNVFDNYDYDSLSPFERNWHVQWKECREVNISKGDPEYIKPGPHLYEGNMVRVFFTGWCYVISRDAYKKIGGFNENVEFYYSDNIVVEQYAKYGIKHALVGNSYVDHIGEKTWRNVLCRSNQRYFTSGQYDKFNIAKTNLWST